MTEEHYTEVLAEYRLRLQFYCDIGIAIKSLEDEMAQLCLINLTEPQGNNLLRKAQQLRQLQEEYERDGKMLEQLSNALLKAWLLKQPPTNRMVTLFD